MAITTEEIEATRKVVEMYILDERRDYVVWMTGNDDTNPPSLRMEDINEDHIYYSLRILDNMLKRVK